MEDRKELGYNKKAMVVRLFIFRKIDNSYSMQQAADLLGISKATYCRLESGKIPDLITFFKLITYFKDDAINYIKK